MGRYYKYKVCLLCQNVFFNINERALKKIETITMSLIMTIDNLKLYIIVNYGNTTRSYFKKLPTILLLYYTLRIT